MRREEKKTPHQDPDGSFNYINITSFPCCASHLQTYYLRHFFIAMETTGTDESERPTTTRQTLHQTPPANSTPTVLLAMAVDKEAIKRTL
eukprot:NODE_8964_length_494_cov_2.804494_g7894_i0.p1 GENE.NODE_8964_length_494_cov_2.804494_g7894_i0~~NODE_8964_length_494_cov_2.804494_g7894_i0.p1  ORF type:complete len:103 (+),score=2.75 NODE_8964_length_494_cov_2.804494_g7894_i0:42-311(+)